MSKLILSASLLLICKILSAQLPNDRNKNIIASYTFCIKGLMCKDSATKDELINAGVFECNHPAFSIVRFTMASYNCTLGGNWQLTNESARFNEKTFYMLHRLQPGSHLFIDGVIARNANGQEIYLKPKVLTIVTK